MVSAFDIVIDDGLAVFLGLRVGGAADCGQDVSDLVAPAVVVPVVGGSLQHPKRITGGLGWFGACDFGETPYDRVTAPSGASGSQCDFEAGE